MADIGFCDDQQTDRRDDRQTKRQMGGPAARPEDAEVPNTTKSSGGSVLLWKGFPKGFRGVPRVSRVSANVIRDRNCSRTLGGVQNPGFEAEGDGRTSRPLI